jgi:hypothetical protein
MGTIKIKPSDESQGDHVVIDEADFDPEKHELLDVAEPVAIPDGWDMLHWKKRVMIARAIAGGEDEITGETANEIINAELRRRDEAKEKS